MANIKPAHLHGVDGTYRKDRHVDRAAHEPKPDPSSLPSPVFELTEAEAVIWAHVLSFADWLNDSDVYSLHMFCTLAVELDEKRSKMTSANMAALRGVASNLGLDPVGRARRGVAGAAAAREKAVSTGPSKFFD